MQLIIFSVSYLFDESSHCLDYRISEVVGNKEPKVYLFKLHLHNWPKLNHLRYKSEEKQQMI